MIQIDEWINWWISPSLLYVSPWVNDYRLNPSFTGHLFEQGTDRMICAHNINVPARSYAHAHTHKGSFRCVEAQWSSGREGSAKRKRLRLSIVAESIAWVWDSAADSRTTSFLYTTHTTDLYSASILHLWNKLSLTHTHVCSDQYTDPCGVGAGSRNKKLPHAKCE